MMRLKNILLMIFISGLLACNQHPKNKSIENTLSQNAQSVSLTTKQLFPENSIGVAYLDTIKENKYFLTVRFPNSNLPDSIFHRDSTNYTKSISINTQPQIFILFDEAGEILTLQNVTGCISEFWCENEGGAQYEPTYHLSIDKIKCKRILQHKNFKILGRISCFAIINYNAFQLKTVAPFYFSENKNVIMRGRLSTDYSGYAYKAPEIYKHYDRNVQIKIEKDDAGGSDYCVYLEVFNNRLDFELGCCGP